MTLRQLRYFVEIVDAGNMSRAAAKLNIAPTALTLQVKAMEQRLGVQLLLRHARGVTPSKAGLELYHSGQQILALVNDTERRIGAGPAAGLKYLRLGALQSIASLIGLHVLLPAEGQPRTVYVQLSEGNSADLVNRLRSHDLDLVIASGVQSSHPLRALDVIEEQLVFLTSPAAGREDGRIELAEALRSDLVFYKENSTSWNAVHETARAARLPVNVVHKIESIDVIRQMVSLGLATAIAPYSLFEHAIRRQEIAIHDIHDAPIRRRISVAWLDEERGADDFDGTIDFVLDAVSSLHARIGPYSKLLAADPGPATAPPGTVTAPAVS